MKTALFSLLFLTTNLLLHTVHAEETIILAVHPYLPHDELKQKFMPLASYLSSQTGKKIEVKIGSSYDEHIQYIGQNKVDIAYMGPASYVSMINKYGAKPVLARLEINGSPWFQGNIITRKNSGINNLQDLKGRTIAYGDPNSTMSYLVPHHMMIKAGVFDNPGSKYEFLHSHNNVALGVLSGDFDAGAVKPEVFRKFESKGLTTIQLTPRISEHLFITRNDLPINDIEKLRSILLNMNQSEQGLSALKSIKKSITGLVGASSQDYENLRQIIMDLEKHP